jgi:hypothetical protein
MLSFLNILVVCHVQFVASMFGAFDVPLAGGHLVPVCKRVKSFKRSLLPELAADIEASAKDPHVSGRI